MKERFTYSVGGRERQGELFGPDWLMGPLSVQLDGGERCYTICSSELPGRMASGILIAQKVNEPIDCEVVTFGQAEDVLETFLEWLPDEGDLREVVERLLWQYLD